MLIHGKLRGYRRRLLESGTENQGTKCWESGMETEKMEQTQPNRIYLRQIPRSCQLQSHRWSGHVAEAHFISRLDFLLFGS